MEVKAKEPLRVIIVITIALVLVSACTGSEGFTSTPNLIPSQAIGAAPYWPTDGWRTLSPKEQGLDSTLLERMFDAMDDQQLDVHGVLVVRNGYIVAETYYAPFEQHTKHHLYSVTKSFVSALIGIAIAQDYIDGVDHRVVDFFPERAFANLDGRKEAMTLKHLLTMTSGLDWKEGMPTYEEMSRTRDWIRYVLDIPMAAEPGSEFNYCSGCSHIMSAIIQKTTGLNTLEFAQSRLFEPLGITNVYWELDGSGIPNGGWGLELTPRDMAKFGYLYLNDGVWDGQQIVPVEWIRASVGNGIDVGDGWRYGYQWWIPPSLDAYAAIGLDAQIVYVIPDLEIVVVLTAELDDADVLFELIETFIIPAARSPRSHHWRYAFGAYLGADAIPQEWTRFELEQNRWFRLEEKASQLTNI